MRRREKPGLVVLLVAALAAAGLLVSCAPGGGESDEKAATPQGGETQEREQTEETTDPEADEKAETEAKTDAKGEAKTETETKGENAPSNPSPPPSAGSGAGDGGSDFGGFDATVRVTNVVDGDTVGIAPAVEGEDRVRLIGVDTPETRDPDCGKQPYGNEATAFTTSELQGQEIGLEFDVERTDRYGRLLAYVYPSDEEMFNETLLQEGYAQVATFPPNVRYVDRFLAAQADARAAGRGLWGLSAEELAAQTDRGNGIGGGGCAGGTSQPKTAPPKASPKDAPTPPPQPTPPPKADPKQPPPPGVAPKGGDVDCSDFSSKAEAQPFLLPGDPNKLDKDRDGQACDSLP